MVIFAIRIQKAERFGPLPDPKSETPAGIPTDYQQHNRPAHDNLPVILAEQRRGVAHGGQARWG